MDKTRLQLELEAQKSGRHADAAFSIACARLGLRIKATLPAPIALIALAQSEQAEARRQSSSAICGND